ncbi:MAG: hypothetical protein ACLFRY_08245 [Spirochaetia bacterium]
MSAEWTRRTALGRPVDFSWTTNIIITAAAGVAFLGGITAQLALRQPVWDSFVWGFRFSLGLFLAWALGREIDPEHDISALIGAALAVPAIIVFGTPMILGGFWLLVALRIVVRTAGPKPGAVEAAIVTALALWLSYRYSRLYGCAAVILFIFDALLPPRNKLSFLFAGISAAGTAVITLFLVDAAGTFVLSRAMGILILGLIAAVLFLILTERHVHARSDDGSHPLSRKRIRAAHIGCLVLGVLLIYQTGPSGFIDTIPLIAAIAGAVLYRPLGLIRRRGR